jgi:chemosensory pili system protein ChpC
MVDTAAADVEVRSLVVPLNDYSILLPGSVVAEIAPYQDAVPLTARHEEADWILGTVAWRGVHIPLISMEALGGEAVPVPGARARLVILKALADLPGLSFYAVASQQIPHLQTVAEPLLEALSDESLDSAPGEAVLVSGEAAVIPDLEAIERRLHRMLQP